MKQVFELHNLPTTNFFSLPICSDDLGAIGKGLFTHKKRILISSLHPRQTEVSGGTLNYKMKGKGFTTPCVVIVGNKNVLIDGHHTVIIKKLKGQQYILAACYLLK